MEGRFIEEGNMLTRVDADRRLRGYRKMDSILRSSQSYGRRIGDLDCLDESAIQAQMYSLRACILALDDARERMILYHYYIKGRTIRVCARLVGVSERTAFRLKGAGLESVAKIMQKRDMLSNDKK